MLILALWTLSLLSFVRVVNRILLFTMIELLGMILPFLLYFRMVLEILPEIRVVRHKLLVVNQTRVFPELLRGVRVVVEVLVSSGQLAAADIQVVAPLELCLTTLKGLGMLLPVLADVWMVVEILLEIRMVRQILLVVNQTRVFPELLRDVRVVVEELVISGQLAAADIQVVAPLELCLTTLKGLG